MTRKEALTGLLERVEKGENWHFDEFDPGDLLPPHWVDAFKGSLDAAKELHEAVLPGWHWAVDGRRDYGCEAEVFTPPEPAEKPYPVGKVIKHQHHKTLNENNPARAWFIAIIKALIEEADNA